MKKILSHYPNTLNGITFTAILAVISYLIANTPWMQHSGISSLVIAILLGIIIGNIWQHPAALTPGIQFSAKRILRAAIVLYGFRVSFQEIASVGIEALLIDTIVVASTLGFGYYLGRKLLKLDRDLSILLSIGAAICGAAAVLAAEDILKSEPYKTAVAVGAVVLFGTISMFLYPFLQNHDVFGFTSMQFGIFAGASIHEVAQALVAGMNINNETGQIAVIVKMIRVLLLVPTLIFLSILISRSNSGTKKSKIIIPWFAIGFAAVIGFNSLHLLPVTLVNLINQFDIILLTMAMGAIGLETKLSKIKKVGIKPLYLALALFAWLGGSVYLMVSMA